MKCLGCKAGHCGFHLLRCGSKAKAEVTVLSPGDQGRGAKQQEVLSRVMNLYLAVAGECQGPIMDSLQSLVRHLAGHRHHLEAVKIVAEEIGNLHDFHSIRDTVERDRRRRTCSSVANVLSPPGLGTGGAGPSSP